MNKFVDFIYKNQAFIYKAFLFVITVWLIVYLFPEGSQFKYEVTKGKPWQYETLYAPFDFAIKKTDKEIKSEKEKIRKEHSPYFDYSERVVEFAEEKLKTQLEETFNDSIMNVKGVQIVKVSTTLFNALYNRGVIKPSEHFDDSQIIYIKKENEAREAVYKSLFKINDLDDYITDQVNRRGLEEFSSELRRVFFEVVEPNVSLDRELTERDLEAKLSNISYTKGIISQGSQIISKGEIVDSTKQQILDSLRDEYQSNFWSKSSYSIVIVGYTILVAMALFMLMLFLRKYGQSIFENNKKITFVFFNILLIVALTVGVMKMDVNYVYAVPICVLPISLSAFFEKRFGLFAHIITILILGFIVPNSYEYIFLQIMVGIVTVLSFSELYKRADIFISVGKITLVYIVAYFAFTVIQEGSFNGISGFTVLMFVVNGILTLFVQALIYAYEKIFGLISDVSLLELSNTNSKLLKDLSNKAPGTFHHSLNVANLAEAAANEIGANAMLVRVAALHHDIGKMTNPTYFTENQVTSVNPHDGLAPKESARIIINHVVHGIEIAKNHQLPDRIIDFIRTHHGTTLVYYFYKKAQEAAKETGEEVDIADYQYPGPAPFSKETAILMMSDSVEAASKSLREPTAAKIDNFVEKIIDKQMEDGQFLNASITFKEIQSVKKILKRKLNNIYHLRVEYPE